ncbi:MAG: hypothetical protein ATN35_03400 [Epulopiscium sp. Nele67-Bin004]|nr:MAG: hypothetical protein ATN35_03400 [Epulopiscium sp. Nele67-Bin004]
MKIKLIDSKFLIVGLLFISVVIYMTTTSIAIISNNSSQFISDMQAEDIIIDLFDDIDLLKDTANSLADHKEIISTLQDAKTNGYSTQYTETLCDTLHNFTYIMSNLSFIRSISVVSISGEFIVSDSEIVENYFVFDRPWFKEEMLYLNDAIVTNVYRSYSHNELTSSIVKFIIDPITGEPLGAILLNIALDKLLYELREDYRIADIDLFIQFSSGIIYLRDDELMFSTDPNFDISAIYQEDNVNAINYKIGSTDALLTLVINLDTINSNILVSENNSFVISRIYTLTFGITIVILIVSSLVLKPIFSAIKSLVHIIEELGESYPDYGVGISRVEEMAKFIEYNLPKKIKYLLYYDELTNLPNRKMFKILFQNYTSTETSFIVMLLDIKNFKGINDACGDSIGDQVLIDISKSLQNAIEDTDGTVIRYSGDEFLVMIETNRINQSFHSFYEQRFLSIIAEPLLYPDKKPIQLEFNAVGVISPHHCTCEDDMIAKIYVMLKKSKEDNTLNLLLYDNAVYDKYISEQRIKEFLKDAIETDEFVINYQPIINKNKKVKKAEALIRWFSKDIGFVPPNEFIYVAEQTRMIIDLGNWIIERVAKDLKTLFDIGNPVQISINISPIQLMEENFVPNAKQILDKYDIDYSYICFEITEGILLEDRGVVKQNIRLLQQLGIHLALDDFGTGYSSFSYLKEYSLNIIKIDKIFVDNATEKDYAIIYGINLISKALGMEMILEGVETQEQFDKLREFGLIQGYYFSKPVVWAEFIKLL